MFCFQCGGEGRSYGIKNPHSDTNEFCSDECARLNRIKFCNENQKVFVLLHGTTSESDVRGVYSNHYQLKLGVEYWMKAHPEDTLYYQEWTIGYPQEPEEWEWCYIPTSSNYLDLASGGAEVPQKIYWGKNLVGRLSLGKN